MSTRRKKERVVVHVPPAGRAHGRLIPGAPAVRSRPEAGDPIERYVIAQVERAVALAVKDSTRYRNAKRRAERARHDLQAAGQLDEVTRINVAMSSNNGAAVRSASKAHVDVRPYAIESAAMLVRLIREHDVRSTSALALLGGAALWLALERLLLDVALERGPGVLSVSKSTGNDGTKISATLPMFGDVLAVAAKAGTTGRGHLLTALDLEQRSRTERGPSIDPLVQKRIADLLASRRALARPTAPEPAGNVEPAMDAEDHTDDDEAAQSIVEAATDEGEDEEGSADPQTKWNPGSTSDSDWVDQKETARVRADAIRQAALGRQATLQAVRRQGLQRLIAQREASLEREGRADQPDTLKINQLRSALSRLREQLEVST